MEDLPKDIVQYLSQFVDEDANEWENLKTAFKNHNQATMVKKEEIMGRPAWVEMWESHGEAQLGKIHFEEPSL